jgi:hypothetical protein
MDLFKPKGSSQPRRPTDDNQWYGNIVDQPRFARFGGLKNGPAIGTKNKMVVQKPGDGKKVI